MKHKYIFILLLSTITLGFANVLRAQNNEDRSSKQDSTINLSEVGTSLQLDGERIRSLPFHKLPSFGLLAPSAYRLKGDRMFYYGIETNGDHTFIDGMQIGDASDFPVRLIQSYSLFTRMAPINMGFALGGITAIETLDQSSDFTVLVDVNTDQSYDAQGINGEIFINVPLSFGKEKEKSDRIPSLLIAGKYSLTNNTDPIWKRTQKLKSGTLATLTANPLRPSGTGSGTFPNAAFVTSNDMVDRKVPDNSGKTGIYPFVKHKAISPFPPMVFGT